MFSNVVENDRRLIKGHEIDIVIPDIRLAIEFNGSYWHSKKMWIQRHPASNENDYMSIHLMKTLKCNEIDYRLIHIWEDEWTEDKERIAYALKKVLKNEEDLSFYDDCIMLDRSWFNNIEIPGYSLASETKPGIRLRGKYEVSDYGWLKFTKDA